VGAFRFKEVRCPSNFLTLSLDHISCGLEQTNSGPVSLRSETQEFCREFAGVVSVLQLCQQDYGSEKACSKKV
jgi:hypothetical protein